ncbi:hypothetical protein ACHAQH_006304 [Verticillium albo-atrum]
MFRSPSMFRSRPQHDVKRIVVCVDGTWYNADGKEGNEFAQVSRLNIWFISLQVAKYFNGIGTKTNSYDKYNDAITGKGCKELVRDVLQKTREGPVIQFLGLFDTVKKAQGDADFDLSYSRSIRRVRHALAMNEERNTHQPELYKTDSTRGWEAESIIQAWFVGWHVDIGGGAKDDGPSLYPLQWMLIESQKHGLFLVYKPAKYIVDKIPVEHPPSLVLPSIISENGSSQPFPDTCLFIGGQNVNNINEDADNNVQQWDFSLASGITINMYDLRAFHRHGNLQKRQGKKLKKKGHVEVATHEVKLNPPDRFLTGYQRRARSVFDTEGVMGYHPEIYFLKDTYPSLGTKDALRKMEDNLEKFSSQFQSSNHGNFFPWMLERTLKTGICNDMDTSRPIETAFELVLGAIAKYAPLLPVVLVGTKKDKFLRQGPELNKEEIRALEAGRALEKDRELDVARDLKKRENWKRRLEIDCAEANQKLDIKVTFVSRDNRESIMALMHLTLEPLSSESLRSGMVAAQVVDTDLKIALAVDETTRLLRTAVTASNLGALLVVVNRISAPTYSRLLCNAIVRSFGLTRTTTGGFTREEDVDHIMSTVVWRNLSSFMARSFFVAIGDLSLLVAAPMFEAPVTARMVIKCACDLIIIMDRAFHVGGKFVTGQQIRQASHEYVQPLKEDALSSLRNSTSIKAGSSRRKLVHRRVNALIPVLSALAVKIYRKHQVEELHQGIQEIIADYRMQSATDHYQESDESVASSDTLSVGAGSMHDMLEAASEDEEDLKEFANLSIRGGL